MTTTSAPRSAEAMGRSDSHGWDQQPTANMLDMLANPTMIADEGMIIRFVNEAAYRMFEVIEADIRKDLPHFTARDVVGKNIDVFHKHPAHQRAIMANLATPHLGKFTVGGKSLAFRANPKFRADGGLDFICVEWRDETEAVEAKRQLADMAASVTEMTAAHALGDIDVRARTEGFAPAIAAVLEEVNQCVEAHISTKKAVVATMTAIAEGNHEAAIEQFPRQKAFLNVAVERMRTTVKDHVSQNRMLLERIRGMVKAHGLGDIDHLMSDDGLSADLADVVNGVNAMVVEHIETKTKVIDCVKQYADGNLSFQLERFPRKKAFINEAMDQVRDNFRSVLADIQSMAEDIMNGDLARAADLGRHKGAFRELMEALDQVRRNIHSVSSEIEKLSSAIVEGKLDLQTDADAFRGTYRQIIVAFERAFQSLNQAFGVITSRLTQVTATAKEINQSSQSLATNSQIQSSSVDQVSASAEETDSQVKANAAAADQASKLVTGASAMAVEGRNKITQMVQAMEGIRVSSQDIAKIIKVIDEIAFQTNLLALNAAVEAARAGQHGRGFAVVAQEVRNLAGRSAKAARETSELIDDAASRVQAGVRIADETSKTFALISDDIEKVQHLVHDIASASGEQSRGVAQINLAIGEVARSALSNSQQAEELAAGSNEMLSAIEAAKGELSRYALRQSASAPAVAGTISGLDQLSPDMLDQIKRMLGGAGAASVSNGSYVNGHGKATAGRDERGFADF